MTYKTLEVKWFLAPNSCFWFPMRIRRAIIYNLIVSLLPFSSLTDVSLFYVPPSCLFLFDVTISFSTLPFCSAHTSSRELYRQGSFISLWEERKVCFYHWKISLFCCIFSEMFNEYLAVDTKLLGHGHPRDAWFPLPSARLLMCFLLPSCFHVK